MNHHFYPTDDRYDDDGKRCDPIIVYEERRCLDTDAPPSLTRGGIDQKNGHNKLVQIEIVK